MPADDGVYFGEETADLILDTVELVQRSGDAGVDFPPQQLSPNQFWYVKLTADLAVATDADTPSTATANVWRAKDDDTLEDTGEEINVTNRFVSFSGSTGDLLTVVLEEGEYIPLSAGGSGGSGSCGCCTCVSNPDLVHPDLDAGADETVQQWELQTECGEDLSPIEAVTADGLGFVTWLGGKPLLVWDTTNGVWELDDKANCTVRNNAGADKTSTSTITADWERDFVSSEEVVTLDLDAIVA